MFAQFPQLSDLLLEMTTSCRRLPRRACDPYRPELHYMRGPGPKWLETHGGSLALHANQAGYGR
jgi:hypothetical protein